MISHALLPEFDQEFTATRKHLERVPGDKLDWAPHEKSMTMRQLAGHIASLVAWGSTSIEEDEFDVAPVDGPDYEPPNFETVDDILAAFDENVSKARALIEQTTDETFMKPWELKKAGEVLFQMPKVAVIRAFVLNHTIHHRGQLSVYLRMCDCPVPQSYGPTADETEM